MARQIARGAVAAAAATALFLAPFMRVHAQEPQIRYGQPRIEGGLCITPYEQGGKKGNVVTSFADFSQYKPKEKKQEAAPPVPEQKFPGIQAGEIFSLPDGTTPWASKPAFFVFSAPWCVGCHRFIPELLGFKNAGGKVNVNGHEVLLSDLIDVHIVVMAGDTESARQDAQNYLNADGISMFNSGGAWIARIFPGTYPFGVLVGKDGRVKHVARVGIGTRTDVADVQFKPEFLQALGSLGE